MSNDLVDLMGWIRVDKRKCFLKAELKKVCANVVYVHRQRPQMQP